LTGRGAKVTMVCAASPAKLPKDRNATINTLVFGRLGSRMAIRVERNVVTDPKVGG